MDWQEFAQSVKKKFPQYSDIPDRQLADKLVAKYPSEYADVKASLLADYTSPDTSFLAGVKKGAGQAAGAGGIVLEGLAQTGQAVAGGLNTVAEKAADFGAAGGVVGVPALMASELVPKSKLDVTLAALSGPISKGVNAVVGKLGAPLAARMTPALQSIASLAEEKGIPLTAADITNSQVLATFESFLAKTPLGSTAITDFRDKQLAAVRSARDSLLARFGPSTETAALGEDLKALIKSSSQEYSKKADALYAHLRTLVPAETQFQMTSLAKKAGALLKNEQALTPGMRDPELLRILTDFSGKDVAPAMNLESLLATRSRLGELIADGDAAVKAGASGQKFMSSRGTGTLKQLAGALSEDFQRNSAAMGGAVEEAHTAASAFYRTGAETFNHKTIQRITNSNPELIVDLVFKPGRVTEINAVKAAVGETGFAPLQQKFTERLLGEAGSDLRPSVFTKNLDKFGEETLRAAYSPEQLSGMRNLADISDRLLAAEKLAGNASGTGRTVVSLATGGLLVHEPLTGAAVLLGPAPLAKLYLSDLGRKYLTQGFKTSIGADVADGLASKILAYLAVKKATK